MASICLQDLSVCLMRGLFEYGTYRHWRNFIAMMRESVAVPQLVLEKVSHHALMLGLA